MLVKKDKEIDEKYRLCEDDEFDQAYLRYSAHCCQDGRGIADMPSRSCCHVESGKLFLCNNYRTLAIFHIKPVKNIRGFSLRRFEQQSEIAR
jgi:hypothetical protein